MRNLQSIPKSSILSANTSTPASTSHSDHVFIQTGYPKFSHHFFFYFHPGSACFFVFQTLNIWMADDSQYDPRDRSNTMGYFASKRTTERKGTKFPTKSHSCKQAGHEDPGIAYTSYFPLKVMISGLGLLTKGPKKNME